MRIYMQTPPGIDKAPRYYHLFLQEDLLDGWTLVKESGNQGSSGRLQRQHFASHEEAQMALVKARDAQLKRGYRVVFAKGDEHSA
ncbi:MAG: WGR domain-containing protein [Gammaproteobacteria bacterium]|nr:WGR domain-containing protein [Gammaproteobacteria bacterium]